MNSDLSKLTKEQALSEYNRYVVQTAQALYDRWPEAHGMFKRCFELGKVAGIHPVQINHDIDHAPIQCDGGRW